MCLPIRGYLKHMKFLEFILRVRTVTPQLRTFRIVLNVGVDERENIASNLRIIG